jgi:predicted nucleotide-binding protein (sugar kinase/HSP70/actin superfamily)
MGIEVDKKITVSQWIYEHMIKKPLGLMNTEFAVEAKPYLGAMIGGHAQETVGHSVLYAKNGYNGIIQVYPLTCMPEIVAESILPSVERDFDVPVLTLVLDELTGEEGFVTRLEAFADLIAQRAL